MALADTAQLLVNLVVKSNASTVLGKDKATLGDLGKTLFSIGGAAGFGALTAGALSAEAAQGKFMAATGKTRGEAEKFVSSMDGLAGSVGTTGMKFEDLAALGTTVEQQFGTTGQKTQDLTEKIAELAKVSGGDANEQAGALGDTLQGMGLDASAAGAVMDNLIASNQQFGTDIGTSITALDNMTPALKGMGLSLQDGQGLLNAFEQANVDAGTAAGDLTRAIKNLKPGQNIDDLIAQVGAIEDPILRAKEATKLFGKAAGPEMAAVIKPGMKSLKDVELQAQDTDGALTDAAAGMETSSDKIRGLLDKIGAGARELGQQFGPALSGIGAIASALGPSLISGVQKAWDAVKNSDAVQSAAQSALDFGGTITGAAGTIIGNLTGNLIQVVTTSWDKVRDWLLTPGSVTQRAIAAGGAVVGTIYAAAVELTAAVESKLQAVWVALGSPGSGVISAALAAGEAAGGSWVAGVIGVIGTAGLALIAKVGSDALSGAAEPGGKNFADNWLASVRNHTAAGAPTLQGIGADAGGQIQTGLKDEMASHAVWEPIGEAAAASLTGAMNAGIADHADELAAETAALAKGQAQAYHDEVNRNKNSLSMWDITRDKQVADTKAWRELWDKSARSITGDMTGTLKGAKKDVQSAMDDLMYAITHPMKLTKETARVESALTSKNLLKGLSSKNPEIKAQAEQTKQRLITLWEQLTGKAYTEGDDASTRWRNGLSSNYPAAIAAARNAAAAVNRWLDSIKNHIRVNVNIDTTGQGPTAHGHRALGGPVMAGVPYIVGEKRPELFVPNENGRIVPRLPDRWNSPTAVAVTVNLSTREFSEQQRHYAVIQTGAPTFR
jgi:hypothetical protein